DEEDLAAHAMDGLRRIVRALRATEGMAERELGLSAAQLFVLRQLADGGRLSMTELARRTATAQSSVSEVAARLVARGLVSRAPSRTDRRRVELALTEEGWELLRHAPQAAQEHLLAGFRHLPVERQRTLADGLRAWLEAAGYGDLAATMFFEPLLESP
ncbi:MAG TPA: MarR family transcriptional regulator, partial [Gemmatimonadaceae bacterium]|nr:MarR family transcriptional regulator [Gemmatimonadaceae bacterium]